MTITETSETSVIYIGPIGTNVGYADYGIRPAETNVSIVGTSTGTLGTDFGSVPPVV